MEPHRSVRTFWLIVLPFGAGLLIGVLSGRLWAHSLDAQLRRAHFAVRTTVQRTAHSEEWKRDSIRWDSIRRHRPQVTSPREIARLQLFRDCMVGFEFPEATHFQIFHSDALGRRGELLGRAVAFSPTGFEAGEQVRVVFTDVECADIGSLSRGGGIGPAQVDSLIRRLPLRK